MPDFTEVMVNDRWSLRLLPHRAARPSWATWEAHRLALTHEIISDAENPVVWEVGAEEGDYPALYATWGARVVIVEPSPRAWPQIKLHWEANTDEAPAGVVLALASDITQTAEADYPLGFFDGWPEVAYGEVVPEYGFRHIWEHSLVSPQIRLDDAGLPAPDLVCMDIEGGELHALRGMEQTLKDHRPDLIVSVHPDFLRDLYGLTPDDVTGFLDSVGYEGGRFCTDHEEHHHYWPR